MKRIMLDKVASALARLDVTTQALTTNDIVARPGFAVVARVLDDKTTYNMLEDTRGRMVRLYAGDIIAGVLGERKALHGFAGTVPQTIAAGDVLHLLNLGGVIGQCESANASVGAPMQVVVLGALLSFPVVGSRHGVPASLADNALPAVDSVSPVPVVFVSGTCMNAGKTAAAVAVVRSLVAANKTVAVAKLTGVAARKDTLEMLDCGASEALTFVDAGLPSTNTDNALGAARAVLASLASAKPDVIVAELGDGLLGEYGVMSILTAPDIAACAAAHVCCASDPVGAYGAMHVFETVLGCRPTVFSGPVTDNAVGIDAIADQLGTPAVNALAEPSVLGEVVLDAVTKTTTQLTTTESAHALT